MEWLKHAFAIDPPGPAQPDPGQRDVIEQICGEVVRRRMSGPALLVLEMSRPLNFLSAQALQFFHPFVGALVDTAGYEQFTRFLERRGSIDYLAERIEALEAAQLVPGPGNGAS